MPAIAQPQIHKSSPPRDKLRRLGAPSIASRINWSAIWACTVIPISALAAEAGTERGREAILDAFRGDADKDGPPANQRRGIIDADHLTDALERITSPMLLNGNRCEPP